MKRIALYALGGLLIVGGVAFWQRDQIRVWLLLHQLDSMVVAERAEAVERLAKMDAIDPLLAQLHHDRADVCESISASLGNRSADWPVGSPHFDCLGVAFIDRWPQLSPSGKRAALRLIPSVLNSDPQKWPERLRPRILESLQDPDSQIRAMAVLIAHREDVHASEAIVPLLKDESDEVRRVAMLAVGPAPVDGEPLIETESLLPWLNDPDAEVRRNCEIALSTRGLSPTEIRLSRKITDRNPVERLKALIEFPDEDDFRIEPWLDRLSRDRDSAVRAGAARVAAERGVDFNERLDEMISSDPDLSVRKIAEHFRKRK